MNKKKFLKQLKHEKTGLRVRSLKKYLAKNFERKVVASSSFQIVRRKYIHINNTPVLADIKHVFFIMLCDKREDLATYLLSNDPGLRMFAELRYKQLMEAKFYE